MKSNRIVNYFAANPKAHPIQMVLPALYNFFVRLLIYHSLKDKSQNSAASALKVSPYAINDYSQGATSFNPKKTEKIISSIRECDRRVKGAEYIAISQNAMLQELVFKILH